MRDQSAGPVVYRSVSIGRYCKRSFAWFIKNRRFARDYERLAAVAETPRLRDARHALAVKQHGILKRALSSNVDEPLAT